MPIKVTLPDIYDNFRSEYRIPVQCKLTPPLDFGLSFRVTAGDRVFEIPSVSQTMLGKGNGFTIPIAPKTEPEVVDVLFEYYTSIDSGIETVENMKIPVHTSGISWIPLGQATSADSVFIRMNLELSSIMSEVRKDKAMEGFVGYKKDVFDPESLDIARISEYILRYLESIETISVVRKDNLLYSSTVQDAVETKKGTVFTKGLLFCHIAYHLGLEPLMIIAENYCLTGVKTCAMDLDDTPLSSKKVDVKIPVDGVYSLGSADGKYILFDMGAVEGVLISNESALKIWNSTKPEIICSVKTELDKNDAIGLGIGV